MAVLHVLLQLGSVGALLFLQVALVTNASRYVVERELAAQTFPPRCKCNREADQSPYRLSDPDSSYEPGNTEEEGYIKSCYTILNVGGCNPSLKCCNGTQGVEKIEIAVPPGRLWDCKPYLKRVTVNGKRWPFEFSSKDSLIRITRLGLNATTAPGSEVCLWSTDWVDCNAPGWMCYPTGGSCQVAIFNKERDCCPVSWTGDQDITAPPAEP